MLYAPAYRDRYRKLLRGDFPRIPFPAAQAPFLHLAALGAELMGLHLLADRRLLDPPVGLVGDVQKPLGPRPRSFLRYWEDEGRLYVNPEDLGFEGISPAVESYAIGGHPVLRRWLRSRCGRVLLPEEILTFRRIASALTFSLRPQPTRSAPWERRRPAGIGIPAVYRRPAGMPALPGKNLSRLLACTDLPQVRRLVH